jgi:hypothetical protein
VFIPRESEINGSHNGDKADPPPYSSGIVQSPESTPLKDNRGTNADDESPSANAATYTPLTSTNKPKSPISEPASSETTEKKPVSTESGLRQRKPALAAEAVSQVKDTAKQAQLALQQSHPEGVPVNIVFILCLVSFLIGYIFF